MKKAYDKPGIYVESFALSQSIARSCGVDIPNSTLGKPTHADPNAVCAWDMGNIVIWTSGLNPSCNLEGGPDEAISGQCYNAPVPGMTTFAS